MRVQARGIDKAIAKIDAIRARVTNLQPAMQVVGEMVVAETKLSFREEASPDGAKWEPLSDVTILRRVMRTSGGLKKLARGQFGPRQRNEGERFDPRRASTKSGRATKRAIKAFTGDARILFDRGALARGISAQASARSVLFGSDRIQARALHLGNYFNEMFRNPAPIPARPFFPVDRTAGKSVLMTTGRGGAMWARARELIRIYILTGRISRG